MGKITVASSGSLGRKICEESFCGSFSVNLEIEEDNGRNQLRMNWRGFVEGRESDFVQGCF
jgi:hypothetical protein